MNMEELEKEIPSLLYKKIVGAEFDSLKSILLTEENELQRRLKLSLQDIQNILQVIAEIILNNKVKTALQINDCPRISSGTSVIDSALHGGLPTNGISEVYGSSGVGKTQFCIQFSLMAQLPQNLGGLGKGVVYICTEDIFPIKRLNQLSNVFPSRFPNADVSINFENNIYLKHIADFEQLRRCLYVHLPNLLAKVKIGLIVIDSIAGAFRSNNENVNYTYRSEDFLTISSKLMELSDKFGIAILCVNQVMDNLTTGKTEPCLGLAWSNIVTHRFKISRTFNSLLRTFEVCYSPDLPYTHCNFVLKEDGLTGVSN